jgi:CHASE3 domain sensor protein
MNRDNISALLTAVAVIALIVGFAIYFNSPELNTAGGESIKQQQLIDKILSPKPSVSVSSNLPLTEDRRKEKRQETCW